MSSRSAALPLLLVAACGHSASPAVPDAPAGACDVPALAITHGAGTPAIPHVHKLPLARYPLAVCNDGTPALYALRPGYGPAARRWVIYLEGGGSCSAGAECAQRRLDTPGLMSSAKFTDGAAVTTDLNGFKSAAATENPDLYDATFVQIHYCSSDQWSGDTAAVAGAPVTDMTHWHFRGRAIVAAAIDDLLGQGLASATDVLLIGSSAGALGVANHVDDLRARLPAEVRLLGALDAGYGLLYPPYDPATGRESTISPSQLELAYTGGATAWGGRGDADCAATATDDLARARCRIPDATFPAGQVTTRLFIRQSQADDVQINQHGAGPGTPGPVQAYRDRFGAQMRARLAGLSERFAVFSTDDSQHGVIGETAAWTGLAVDGVVLHDALGAWYRDPCAGGAKRIAP